MAYRVDITDPALVDAEKLTSLKRAHGRKISVPVEALRLVTCAEVELPSKCETEPEGKYVLSENYKRIFMPRNVVAD